MAVFLNEVWSVVKGPTTHRGGSRHWEPRPSGNLRRPRRSERLRARSGGTARGCSWTHRHNKSPWSRIRRRRCSTPSADPTSCQLQRHQSSTHTRSTRWDSRIKFMWITAEPLPTSHPLQAAPKAYNRLTFQVICVIRISCPIGWRRSHDSRMKFTPTDKNFILSLKPLRCSQWVLSSSSASLTSQKHLCVLEMSIPVVDFGALSLGEEDVTHEQLQELSTELKTAFTEVGFVFLENTGISQEEVRMANKAKSSI